MHMRIEVTNRKEAEQLRAGLALADIRAFVRVMGTLEQLPSDRARARVLQFIKDHFDDVASATAAEGDR